MKPSSRQKHVWRRGATGFGTRAAAIAGRFALLLVLASRYSPESVGAYGLVTATVTLSLYLVGLDYYTFTTREGVSDPAAWPALVREQVRVQSFTYVLMALPVALAGVTGILTWNLAAWCLLLVVTDHLSLEMHRLMVARARPVEAHIAFFIRTGAWAYLWAGLAILATPPLWTLWALWAAGGSLASAYGWRSERALFRSARHAVASPARLRRGIRVAATLLASTLALRTASSIDRYLLAGFKGDAEVGIYTFHASVTVVILVLTEAAVVIHFLPRLLSAEAGPDHELARLHRSFRQQLVGVGAGTALVLCLAAPILYAIVDPTYRVDWEVGAWLVGAQLTAVTGLGLHYRLYGARRDKSIVLASLVGLGTTLVADLLLIPPFGAAGAAAGTFVAFLGMNLARVVTLRRTMRAAA